MLGVVGRTRFVMGCVTQREDGRYSLEDLSASLPLDLSTAQVGAGFITGGAALPGALRAAWSPASTLQGSAMVV